MRDLALKKLKVACIPNHCGFRLDNFLGRMIIFKKYFKSKKTIPQS